MYVSDCSLMQFVWYLTHMYNYYIRENILIFFMKHLSVLISQEEISFKIYLIYFQLPTISTGSIQAYLDICHCTLDEKAKKLPDESSLCEVCPWKCNWSAWHPVSTCSLHSRDEKTDFICRWCMYWQQWISTGPSVSALLTRGRQRAISMFSALSMVWRVSSHQAASTSKTPVHKTCKRSTGENGLRVLLWNVAHYIWEHPSLLDPFHNVLTRIHAMHALSTIPDTRVFFCFNNTCINFQASLLFLIFLSVYQIYQCQYSRQYHLPTDMITITCLTTRRNFS